jgi:hypothetical protein
VFVLILVAFVVYAYAAPATYRATAAVHVNGDRKSPRAWPKPPQAAARFRARLLEPKLLDRLARAEHPEAPDTEALVAARIAASLDVATADAHEFTVSASAHSAAGAQRISSELAREAAADPASIFDPKTEPAVVPATFVRASLPKAPVRPNRMLVVLVGLTVGMVWGAGAAIGRISWAVASARRRMLERARAASESATDTPLQEPHAIFGSEEGEDGRHLAEVLWPTRLPVHPARIAAQPVAPGWAPDRALAFASRSQLCDELLPFLLEGCFVLGVTAVPERRVHKAILASELALALADSSNLRVLLLEADFHSPDVHRALGLDMSASSGFSQQLRARVHGNVDDFWHVIDCGRSLHVIAEGSMRAPGMVLSNQFEEAIRSFRSYYDIVVINGPLTSAELDCHALDAVLDGVLLACPPGGSPFLSRGLGIFKSKPFTKAVEL